MISIRRLYVEIWHDDDAVLAAAAAAAAHLPLLRWMIIPQGAVTRPRHASGLVH